MHLWMKATLIASTIGGTLVTISILLLIWRFCGRRVCRQVPEEAAAAARSKATTIDQSFQFQAGYRPRANYIYNEAAGDSKMRSNHSPYRIRGGSVSKPPLFSWVDHPDLVTDAAETGWSRFGFVNHSSSMRSPSNSMLGFRESQQQQQQVELSWEVGHGSVDFMQKIRLNNNSSTESAGKKRKMTLMMLLSSSSSSSASCSSSSSSSAFRVKSAIRTSLPLPGPASASSFPQEAYFEITVLAVHDQEQEVVAKDSRVRGDGEIMTTKLIGGNNNYVHVHGIRNSRSLVHVTSLHTDFDGAGKVMKTSGGGGAVRVSLGLATGGPLPLRVPGSFPGSIGFNSNGSIYLDGTKLVYESEKEEWGQVGKVIGCGFDPRQRKVFFVVDSEIVHVIRCKSEEFGTPLFPVLAANVDITVLVNFGQSSFSYTPANSRRTPNPCFVRAAAAAAAALPGLGLGDEDSRELFSMGRIDSGWLNRCTTRNSTAATTTTSIAVVNNNNHHHNNNNDDKGGSFEIDEEFEESDLFEIVLDVTAKSPIKPKL